MKIFLIGFMGSGKTTVGTAIAEKLQYQFIDLDSYIERKYSKTISEIFEQEGENKFREIEQQYLNEIIQYKEDAVIAAGGGTPCFNNNMELMNKYGITFYLTVPEDVLFKRLQPEILSKPGCLNTNVFVTAGRPLINKLSEIELKNFISEKMKERKGYYEQANHIIDVLEEGFVDRIIQAV